MAYQGAKTPEIRLVLSLRTKTEAHVLAKLQL